jgi:predicted Ser/Thr protein kinase
MIERREVEGSRFRRYLNKKYETFQPDVRSIESLLYDEKNLLEIRVIPEHHSYMKLMELTVRDYDLRDKIYKLKKGKTFYHINIKINISKSYNFSFYLVGKDLKFKRKDITMDDIKKNLKVIEREQSKGSESKQPSTNAVLSPQFIPVKRSWPTSSQYAQSLQNPEFSISKVYEIFKDAKFEKNANVKYSSIIQGAGNFGVVFKYTTSSNFYAMKCFTRGSPNIERRYYEISSKIQKGNVPFLLDFKFYPDLVRVTNKPKEYFPSVTMPWLDGVTLHTFIKENLDKSALLKKIAADIVNCVINMQHNQIAHGDLSCDNIIIDGSQKVWLIDYDGMYVENLKNLGSEELGHQSFQHPSRNRYYGEKLDNFSILVIYLSILSISQNSELWTYNSDDPDKLLFDVDDFKNPYQSKVFQSIIKMGGKPKKVAELLIDFLSHEPEWDNFNPEKILKMR